MFLGRVIYLAGRRYLPPEPQRLAPPVAAVQGARASHRRIWWLLPGVGIAATLFRGAYEQVGHPLPLWSDTGVDRVLLGLPNPMTCFQSLDPLLGRSMTPPRLLACRRRAAARPGTAQPPRLASRAPA